MTQQPDVIVVGAGVMGCGMAYWLSKAGYRVLVLEQEAIACGASGVAAAMLESVGHGAHLTMDDPLTELAGAGFELHQELRQRLVDESGVDIGYRENPVIHPAFTAAEVESLRAYAAARVQSAPAVRWLEGEDLWAVEPRLNRAMHGALVTQQAQVLAYRFVLALARAAERQGMELRHGTVIGLERQAARLTGVRLRNGETLSAPTVVLAMGPWSQQIEAWVDVRVPIYPVRGQLLELHVPEPQLRATISYGGMYLVHKADGMTLAGTTEEHESGFVTQPTAEGRQRILEAALHMAPTLEDAEVSGHVCGLRPCTSDRLPLMGAVPGWPGVYLLAGHFRSGMLLSAISTRCLSELIQAGKSSVSLAAFDPARFTTNGFSEGTAP
ncbi:MAG: FAD-dependent oxidoreductase [Candidatus Tectomicrobia bacterium]|uniref:FAD-dependent oxidoreductase n=1 Tax=Tectimicrobiota bacterium TaxID=2528274 RepID=A0A937W0J5_UNCTE|nr:FAD-dependent oxidoreductase [Candidatus Tectomicrobia bacterium]